MGKIKIRLDWVEGIWNFGGRIARCNFSGPYTGLQTRILLLWDGNTGGGVKGFADDGQQWSFLFFFIHCKIWNMGGEVKGFADDGLAMALCLLFRIQHSVLDEQDMCLYYWIGTAQEMQQNREQLIKLQVGVLYGTNNKRKLYSLPLSSGSCLSILKFGSFYILATIIMSRLL